tara:strand:+ start:3549 stop:3842 length:294 start_codon:yes stop_codon:yes gene_type:complete
MSNTTNQPNQTKPMIDYATKDYLSDLNAASDYHTELAATEGLDPYYEAYCGSPESEAGEDYGDFKAALLKSEAARLPAAAGVVPWPLVPAAADESPF